MSVPAFSELVLRNLDRHSSTGDIDRTAIWVRDRLGETLWSKQREIMRALKEHRRVAVKSAHGTGKSFTASRIVAEFLDSNPVGDAFAVTTAPSFSQVRTILWRYIGQAHRKGKLVGRVNQTEWMFGTEPIGIGRKPSDYDESTFQGIHALKILVVIDEAGGVNKTLWDSAEALLTNDDSCILAVGNPDDPTSHFKKICEPGSGWHVITISAFDTPNFTDEDVPDELRRVLVSKQYVKDAEKNWGKDSPLYISKVDGEFPEDAEDGVIPGSALNRCCINKDEADLELGGQIDQFGLDVGAGGDASVLSMRSGNSIVEMIRWHTADPMLLVGQVMVELRARRPQVIAIDVIGIGWGVAGRIEELIAEQHLGTEVVKFNAAEASRKPKEFANKRAELWWMGRELSMAQDSTEWNLARVNDQTKADLLAPKYSVNSRGQILIESKDDIRARLGRSPDDGDSVLLAYWTGRNEVTLHRPTDLAQSVTSGQPGRVLVHR